MDYQTLINKVTNYASEAAHYVQANPHCLIWLAVGLGVIGAVRGIWRSMDHCSRTSYYGSRRVV